MLMVVSLQVSTTNRRKSLPRKVLRSCICLSNPTRSGGYVATIHAVPSLYLPICTQVEQAVREIKRLLIEASAAALQAEMRNPTATAGRYSVV